MRNLILLPLAALVLGRTASAQSRQSTCLWSEDFEQGIPAGWSTNQVERQTSAGIGLGEFVPAFVGGTASDANAGGFFPVPDMPVGNRFAMANDDAAPCNCDLDSAVLATSSIDLSGHFNIALDLRVFHTRALGGGEARIDFSANGGEWLLFETIPSGEGWQRLTFNMSLLGGIGDLRLRFQWSDSANWSSGFAIDDICIREQFTNDLAVTGARMGDANASPFASNSNGLGYRLLPLEQSRAMALSIDLHNVGTSPLYAVAVSVMANQGGTDHGPFTASLDSISSGERATVVVQADWAPDAPGVVTYTATAYSPTGEEDAADNSAQTTMTMTGPGWDDGYGAMALDAGPSQGVKRSDLGFIAAIRAELANTGSTARGITALLDPASTVGQEVRGILLNSAFELIDTTLRHAITTEDIADAFAGVPLYLPFTTPPQLPAADCFAGLQRLPDLGSVGVLTSGNGPIGSAAFMEGASFDITWMEAMPMVRLHLSDYGVGVRELSGSPRPRVFPMPASEMAWLEYDWSASGPAILTISDPSGRVVARRALPASPPGERRILLDTTSLSSGAYLLRVEGAATAICAKLVVAR